MAAMIAALPDSSYAVAGSALGGLNKIDQDTGYYYAKKYVNTDPQSALDNAVWAAIGKKGTDEDIMFYEQWAPYKQGTKVFSFAVSLNNYLKNVKSNDSYKRGVDVYATMVINQNMKQYRAALAGYMFQMATDQNDNLKSDNKDDVATAQKRLDILKPVLQKIVDQEKDPETLKDLQKKMKDNFQ